MQTLDLEQIASDMLGGSSYGLLISAELKNPARGEVKFVPDRVLFNKN